MSGHLFLNMGVNDIHRNVKSQHCIYTILNIRKYIIIYFLIFICLLTNIHRLINMNFVFFFQSIMHNLIVFNSPNFNNNVSYNIDMYFMPDFESFNESYSMWIKSYGMAVFISLINNFLRRRLSRQMNLINIICSFPLYFTIAVVFFLYYQTAIVKTSMTRNIGIDVIYMNITFKHSEFIHSFIGVLFALNCFASLFMIGDIINDLLNICMSRKSIDVSSSLVSEEQTSLSHYEYPSIGESSPIINNSVEESIPEYEKSHSSYLYSSNESDNSYFDNQYINELRRRALQK